MEHPDYTIRLFDLLLVILSGQGLYVVILLLVSRQGRSLSNTLLALIILGYSLQLLDLYPKYL